MGTLVLVSSIVCCSIYIALREKVVFERYQTIFTCFWFHLCLVLVNYFLGENEGMVALVEKINDISFVDFLWVWSFVEVIRFWNLKRKSNA